MDRVTRSFEVVQEPLPRLDDQDWLREPRREELREVAGIGPEQADRGQLVPLDLDAIRASVQQRLAEGPCPG